MRGGGAGEGRGDRDRRHEGHANASQHATRDYEQIAQEILEEAAEIDRREDELYGEKRGDELPAEWRPAQGRRGWLREAKRRLDEERAEEAKPVPRSRPQRLKESRRRLEEELSVECAANAAYEAYRARGVRRTAGASGIAEAISAAEDAGGKGQRDRPRLAQREDAARIYAGL